MKYNSSLRALLTFCLFLITQFLYAQKDLLKAGPMVGYTSEEKASVWVQTKKEANVIMRYFPEGSSDTAFAFTKLIRTRKEDGFTVVLETGPLKAGITYGYEIFINSQGVPAVNPQKFRIFNTGINKPADLRIALGSCADVSDTLSDKKKKSGSPDIYKTIYKKNPDIMLWLGDNCYYRKADLQSRDSMILRYSANRGLSQLQPLLAGTEHVAIWDDHDYGPNDSDKNFVKKDTSLQVYNLFWPSHAARFSDKSIARTFVKEDVQFFLLDNRSFRTPNKDFKKKREILGKEQLDWLIAELKKSTATFRVIAIGGQVLNPLKIYENYATYEEEQTGLLTAIEKEQIPGVIFLSGDRHFSEMLQKKRTGIYPLYEFTVSPLTTSPFKDVKEKHPLRISDSLITQNNFAILEFSGKEKNREMVIRYYNVKGDMLMEKRVKAIELR